MKTIKTILILTIAGVTFVTSCKKKGCTDHHAQNYDAKAKTDDGSCTYAPVAETETDFKLMFYHMSGTQAFALNTTYVDDFGNDYQFTRAQLYLSNPSFFDDNGNELGDHDHPTYALVNHDVETYDFGHVPVGHIHSMEFLVGIDSVTNHSDPSSYAAGHPLANQSPTTHWTWNAGYIFIMLEGVVDMNDNGTFDAGETFLFHIGLDSYKVNVPLMAHFNAEAGMASTVHLNLDWSKFLSSIDLSIDNSTHTMGAGASLAGRVKSNVTSAFSLH